MGKGTDPDVPHHRCYLAKVDGQHDGRRAGGDAAREARRDDERERFERGVAEPKRGAANRVERHDEQQRRFAAVKVGELAQGTTTDSE